MTGLTRRQHAAIIGRWQAAADWVTAMQRRISALPPTGHRDKALWLLVEDEAARADPTLPRHVIHKGRRDVRRHNRKGRAA